MAAGSQTAVPVSTRTVCPPPVERLRALIRRRPFFVRIETINVCNARCAFCAYRKTNRRPTVMAPALFEKVVRDYVDLGGGAVGLTPIVGDVLLDPCLTDRLDRLRRTRGITHVSLITNAIAWDRYSRDRQQMILERVDGVHVSLGGPDAASYRTLYGVDRFDVVRRAIHAMADMKSRCGLPVEIHLAFRADRLFEDVMNDPRMDEFRRPGITSITGTNAFANWGGLVGPEDVPDGVSIRQLDGTPESIRRVRRNPCYEHFMNPEITADGLVRTCACANPEAPELVLADVKTTRLRDIWTGDAMARFRASFGTDALPETCARCTAYQDGEVWLHHPALAHFQIGDNPWDVIRKHAPPLPTAALSDAMTHLLSQGYRRPALYGAGRFTRSALGPERMDSPSQNGPEPRASARADSRIPGLMTHSKPAESPIIAIIDDDPDLVGTDVAGIPVVTSDQAARLGIDAVVIASQWYASELWEAAAPLREAGIHCVMLATTAGEHVRATYEE